MIGILCGCVLLILGLVPGLFQGLVNGVRDSIHNFYGSFSSPLPVRPRHDVDYERSRGPIGLVIAGTILITLTVAAYLWI